MSRGPGDRPAPTTTPRGDSSAVLSRHLAGLLARIGTGVSKDDLEPAVSLLAAATAAGHVCVDLQAEAAVRGRDYARWAAALTASDVVGAPGDYRPLVLDPGGRLYFHRYWRYEQALAEDLRARAARLYEVDEARLRDALATLFPAGGAETNWQKVAAAVAVLRGLCVISGGPGTGKTTTVVRILALLGMLADTSAGAPPRIGLAAPTGKAAARMQEAIRGERDKLDLPEALRERIPEAAGTLHRLLGGTPDSTRFRFHRERPLPLDVLVVDEASMVDLALMAKLVDALPVTARLVLIGDKDQLASVEAGAVLSDLCARENGYSSAFAARLSQATGDAVPAADAASPSPMADCTVLLERSYRFGAGSGIAHMAQAVRAGDADGVLAVLEAREKYEDLQWQPTLQPGSAAFAGRIAAGLEDYARAARDGSDPAAAIAAFNRFRVLTAHRSGPYGVGALNHLVERILAERGLLAHGRQLWYPGRPIMISRNHYGLRLFNGDTGVALHGEDNALRVWFQNADGSLRSFAPARLPAHDTAYALTVHKSQGSEFDQVLLMLPDQATPVLTRELLYTAVTRARRGVEIWGRADIIETATRRRSQRNSGLRDALWPPSGRPA